MQSMLVFILPLNKSFAYHKLLLQTLYEYNTGLKLFKQKRWTSMKTWMIQVLEHGKLAQYVSNEMLWENFRE